MNLHRNKKQITRVSWLILNANDKKFTINFPKKRFCETKGGDLVLTLFKKYLFYYSTTFKSDRICTKRR